MSPKWSFSVANGFFLSSKLQNLIRRSSRDLFNLCRISLSHTRFGAQLGTAFHVNHYGRRRTARATPKLKRPAFKFERGRRSSLNRKTFSFIILLSYHDPQLRPTLANMLSESCCLGCRKITERCTFVVQGYKPTSPIRIIPSPVHICPFPREGFDIRPGTLGQNWKYDHHDQTVAYHSHTPKPGARHLAHFVRHAPGDSLYKFKCCRSRSPVLHLTYT